MRPLLLTLALLLALAAPAAAADPDRPASLSRTTYRATYTVAASQDLVTPDAPRTVTVTVEPLASGAVDLVVVQVLLTSAITVDEDHAPFCEQPVDEAERGGRRHTMTCVLLQVDAPRTIVFHLPPFRVVADPIRAACAIDWYLGTPVSISESGAEVFYQRRVWSPYQPGYCAYAPAVTTRSHDG